MVLRSTCIPMDTETEAEVRPPPWSNGIAGPPTSKVCPGWRWAPSADSSTAYVMRPRTFHVWTGELYLEAHRATLTTHADVKLANRRGEEALRAAEMWSVAARLDRRRDLEHAWRLLLLEQFHDILPGSSIHWVYDDTREQQAEARRIANPPSAIRSVPWHARTETRPKTGLWLQQCFKRPIRGD